MEIYVNLAETDSLHVLQVVETFLGRENVYAGCITLRQAC